jgi:hypothetical protein
MIYASVQRSYFDSLTADEFGQGRGLSIKGPGAWGVSERMHMAFDKLSGVSADERMRTDLIHDNVFRTVQDWFDAPILKKYGLIGTSLSDTPLMNFHAG